MEHVAADFVIPVDSNDEREHSRQACCNMLTGLSESGHNSNHAKHWDEPEQALLAAQFLEIKTRKTGTENLRPRQEKADAQTEGAEADQMHSAQTDGLIVRGGRRGFRFRCDGDFVGHNDFLWLFF